ncbi:asparaginase [Pseudonocardia spinosispora]|uniref:asparaginase n=1 Tax=Pseudonocardia spinosispora TaxID=103441 RepID=UPI00048E9C1B|nr:asparaginase [Pseudonocardia spinosispora]
MTTSVVVAEMLRGGVVESRHHGSAVVTAPDGTVEWSTGPVARPMFPRSANKPMQALGMLRSGLRLDGELLALAAGSHSGESIHVEGVRRILGDAGLDETALRNPRAYPFDPRARKAWMRAGLRKKAVTMGCSGKHAAMLATCVTNDWPIQGYLAPDHPLQLAIRAAVQDFAHEQVAAVTVDGCGAPLLAVSLTGLARAFGRFASAPPGTDEGRIARAFREHPHYVSGTRRTSAKLIRSTPGLFCKTGAEGVVAAGLPDGRGIAVKIDDGNSRAHLVVLAAVLQRLGVDNDVIRARSERPVYGGRTLVGVLRPAADLIDTLPVP